MNIAPMNEIFANLTTYPGVLVYHLLILFSLLLVLFQIQKAYLHLPIKRFHYFRFAVFAMIGLQGLLLILSIAAWIGIPVLTSLHPFAFRLVTMLTYLCLLWIVFSDQPKTWKHITTGSIVFILLTLTIISFIFWQRANLEFSNGNWLDITWISMFAVLCLASGVLLYIEKTDLKPYVIALICFPLFGLLMQMLVPNAGNLPALMMASQLFVYVLIPELTCKLINSGYLLHRDEVTQNNAVSGHQKVDITPRLAAAILDVALQHSYKKIQNAVSHAISLFMMADICGIVHLDSEKKQLHIESTYDLIREDYLKDFSLTEEQTPALFHAFQDGKWLKLNKKDHSQDITSLYQAIGYNQLGDPVIFPIKYNGKAASCAFLFLNPFTMHRWDQEALDRLSVVSPTLARILDNAVEVDSRNQALDDLRVSLNQATRENQKLSKQQERNQQLLSELRTEFNNSKSSHSAEVQLWIERQKGLEDKIETLTTQITQSAAEVEEARDLKAKNQDLQVKLKSTKAQNEKLTNALGQAKAMIESILNPPNDLEDTEPGNQEQPKEPDQKPKASRGKVKLIQNCSPKKCAKKIIDEFTDTYAEKNIQLEVDLKKCPEEALVNADALNKILNGLLKNALLASPNGSKVHLELLSEQKEDNDVLVIETTDQGGGLSLQEQDSFFTYIERVGQPVPGGVGDAQAMREVLRAVKEIEGNIWIKSDVNKPTIYQVDIPVQLPGKDLVEKEDLPE